MDMLVQNISSSFQFSAFAEMLLIYLYQESDMTPAHEMIQLQAGAVSDIQLPLCT